MHGNADKKNALFRKKNILIITKEMLPYAGCFGNCQRMYYLANFLAEKGYRVTVMAEKGSCNNPNLKGMKKKYVNCWLEKGDLSEYRLLYARWIKKVSSEVLNEIHEAYAFQHLFWMIINRKRILSYVGKNIIETVIISGPCFSIFKLGGWIKKKHKNVKVILDYRDPWNLWNDGHSIAGFYEYKCIKQCDKVVCFSDDFKRAMMKRFPSSFDKYEVVYNGFSNTMWEGIETQDKTNKSLTIKYLGAIDFPVDKGNYRNPENLIKAFLKICGNRDVALQFVGVSDMNQSMHVIEKKSDSKIKFIPPVSARESLIQMMDADILVILHDAGKMVDKYILNAKLFDYLRSGKLILNIGNKDNALSRFVEDNSVGVSCVNDRKMLERELCHLYDKWLQNGRRIERDNRDFDCSKYSREYQNSKYLELI